MNEISPGTPSVRPRPDQPGRKRTRKAKSLLSNIYTVLCFNGQKEETNKVRQIIEFVGDFQEAIQGNMVK